jgi:hypothetical protein
VVLWHSARGVVVYSSPVGGLRGRAWGRSRGQRVGLDLHMQCDVAIRHLIHS